MTRRRASWPLWATDIWINGYLGQECIFRAVVIICSPFSNLRIEVGVDRGLSFSVSLISDSFALHMDHMYGELTDITSL